MKSGEWRVESGEWGLVGRDDPARQNAPIRIGSPVILRSVSDEESFRCRLLGDSSGISCPQNDMEKGANRGGFRRDTQVPPCGKTLLVGCDDPARQEASLVKGHLRSK